jgi:LysR family transcriptional activator of dmlA
MTNNGTVAKQWCLKGHGIMLRSIWDLQQDFLSGTLVRVLPEYHQSAEIHVIYASRLETSAKLRTCVAYLEEALPRFAGTGIS